MYAFRVCCLRHRAMSTSTRAINIADLRLAAERRLPKLVFDYLDGGAEAERTLRGNTAAFERTVFRPQCGVRVPTVDLSSRIVGQNVAVPFILAPIGSARLFWPRAGAPRACVCVCVCVCVFVCVYVCM